MGITTTIGEFLLFYFAVFWIFVPGIVIVVAWSFQYRPSLSLMLTPKTLIPLLGVTISYGWVLFELFFKKEHSLAYSSSGQPIIWINLCAMAVFVLWILFLNRPLGWKWLVPVSCVLTAPIWYYLEFFSSVASGVGFGI